VRACPLRQHANARCQSLVASQQDLCDAVPDRLTLETPRLTERIAAQCNLDFAQRPFL
jgi:hypothetical protein